ncbi:MULTISPECIES: hypothetical protein [unclassified Cupriavidus]|uniref:hypothetical protein n=1 Tax=unclassified Cupriavidus TaxID=2640874 RepID=UPI0012EC0694|nr:MULTISPECIES: hypothetical protein [unclassified Cupriavidus]MBP0631576.1 hypothetical protein [Cupriavidus sp. AcVe19-1a]
MVELRGTVRAFAQQYHPVRGKRFGLHREGIGEGAGEGALRGGVDPRQRHRRGCDGGS